MDIKSIRTNAGIVWKILSDNKQWKIGELKLKSGLSESALYAAIGWLARDNKIEFGQEPQSGECTYFLQFNLYI